MRRALTRRRQIVLGTASLAALALTPRGRLALADEEDKRADARGRAQSRWTPAAGDVRAITTDVAGKPVNTLISLKPTNYPASGPKPPWWGVLGTSGVVAAWGSSALARDYSKNGAMLFHNGGDGDYWGNEVYVFDFDTRRFDRLSNPCVAMSGDFARDPNRPTTDPLHFNRVECEHGPAVAERTSGLLPAGTEPGVPHNYDGLVYLPGRVFGNVRGALLRPHSTFVYTTRSTGRAHYFDLDLKQWGRFSSNRATFGSAGLPISGYDEATQRVYHRYGFLDLQSRLQVTRRWVGLSYATSSVFDPKRRLWLMPTTDAKDLSPGALLAYQPDTDRDAPTLLAMSGDEIWPKCYSTHAGILYCPDLDCFFLYCQRANTPAPYDPQLLYRITPPASSPLSNPWTVHRIKMNGDSVAKDPKVAGNYKRFLWVPALKCIAFLNSASGHVYLYKPIGV